MKTIQVILSRVFRRNSGLRRALDPRSYGARTVGMLLVCSLLSCAGLYAADPVLLWDANAETDLAGYQVYYGTASGTYGTPIDVGNTTTYTISGLTSGTYYFAVTAYNASGDESGFSNEVSATIETVIVTDTPPAATGGVSPSSSATGVTLTPTLTWSAAGGATSYDVYFGTSSTPPLVTNTVGTTYPAGTLNSNTLYYWRVVAKNSSGSTSSATISFITVTAPGVPGSLSPANSASGVALLPTLSWSSAIGADSYDVYFGTSNTPPLVLSTRNTSYSPGKLNSNSTYYWRVAAVNEAGSNSSEIAFFDTAQTMTLAYPYLISSDGHSQTEDDSMHTGIAWTNLGSQVGTLTLTAYDESGIIIEGPGITNPTAITLQPGEQLPVVDTQIFGEGLNSRDSIGWIRAESSSDKITSLFMIFNNSLTLLDGANLTTTGMTSFVLPQIKDNGYTLISIANAHGNQASLSFELLSAEGQVRSSVQSVINPYGAATILLSDLFPGVSPRASDYIRVTSDQTVVPLQILGRAFEDIDCLSGQDGQRGSPTLYSPQYVSGGGWSTGVSVINLDPTKGTVRFRLIGDDGIQIGATMTMAIEPYGKIYLTDPALISGMRSGLTQGYLEIMSDGPRLTGSVEFGDSEHNTFSSALPLAADLHTSVVFDHLVSNGTYFTGLALLNVNEESANVVIDVYSADGRRDYTTHQTIPAHQRISKLLTEYFPELQGQNRASGYIRVTSDKGLASFALFGTSSALSALPWQIVP